MYGHHRQPPEFERATHAQVSLWILVAYITYATACFAIETHMRDRFQVRRKAEVESIVGRRDRLIAEAGRSSNLREMEGSSIYKMYTVTCVTFWGALSLASAVAIYRMMRVRGRAGLLHVEFLALAVSLPAIFVFVVGIVPLEMAPKLWERGFTLF